MNRLIQPQQRVDRGFTLVELLIVIVILGILATVTVFAVRGITDKGQENAEGTDVDTLETAIDAYWMDEGSNPTEAELVSAGYLKEVSTLHDIVVAGDGSYTITNVRTGTTVGSGAVGDAPAPPGGVGGWSGTPTSVGGVQAVSYGDIGAHDQYVIIAGAGTKGGWNAAVDATAPLAAWFVVVDPAAITSPAIADSVQSAARDGATFNGFYVVVEDDQTSPFAGSASLLDYFSTTAWGPALQVDRSTFLNAFAQG